MQIGVRQSAPTYDYEIENEELARRQKIADAMQQGSLAPMTTEMVSGIAIPRSPWEAAGKLAQNVAATMTQRDIKEKRKELGDRYGQEISEGMQKLNLGMQGGKTAVVGETGPELQDVQADPRAALAEALSSRNPVVRERAMKMQDDLAKRAAEDRKIALEAASPQSRLAMLQQGGDIKGLKTKVEKDYDAEGNLIQMEQVRIGGDLYEKNPQTGSLRKLDNAPKITTNIKVDSRQAAENEFSKVLGRETAARVNQTFEAAAAAQTIHATANKLEEMETRGVYSGPAANVVTTLGAFAETLGIPVDKEKIGRSEQYNSVLAGQIAKYLTAGAGVGRSLTDADRQALEKQFPALILSPDGRKKIIGLMRQEADRDIAAAKALQTRLEESYPELGRITSMTPVRNPIPMGTGVNNQGTSPVPPPAASGAASKRVKLGDYKLPGE